MELEEDSASASDAPDFITYDLDNEDEDDEDNEGMMSMIYNNPSNNDTEMNGNGTLNTFIPKTMAELAEDAARTQQTSPSSNSSRSSSIRHGHLLRRQFEREDAHHPLADGGINEHANVTIDAQVEKFDTGIEQSPNGVVEAEAGDGDVDETVSSAGTPNTRKLKSGAQSSQKEGRSTRTAERSKRVRKVQLAVRVGADDNADDYNGGAGRSVKRRKKSTRPTTTTTTRKAPAGLSSSTSTNASSTGGGDAGCRVPASTRTLRPRTSKNYYQD